MQVRRPQPLAVGRGQRSRASRTSLLARLVCQPVTPPLPGRAAAATTGFGVAMLPSTFMTMRFGAR